jgi:hypothetical protein
MLLTLEHPLRAKANPTATATKSTRRIPVPSPIRIMLDRAPRARLLRRLPFRVIYLKRASRATTGGSAFAHFCGQICRKR